MIIAYLENLLSFLSATTDLQLADLHLPVVTAREGISQAILLELDKMGLWVGLQ